MIFNDDRTRVIGREWKCDCGAMVQSHSGYDCHCARCGQDYNAFGQRLRKRYVYDEDIGRHVDTWVDY